jgi:hypothetical protein
MLCDQSRHEVAFTAFGMTADLDALNEFVRAATIYRLSKLFLRRQPCSELPAN